jgi:hypothetical protein
MQGDWSLTLGIDAPGHPHSSLKLKVSPPRRGFAIEGKGAGVATTGKAIDVSLERQQLIGVTFDTVKERPLTMSLRAAGRVAVDERLSTRLTSKSCSSARQARPSRKASRCCGSTAPTFSPRRRSCSPPASRALCRRS